MKRKIFFLIVCTVLTVICTGSVKKASAFTENSLPDDVRKNIEILNTVTDGNPFKYLSREEIWKTLNLGGPAAEEAFLKASAGGENLPVELPIVTEEDWRRAAQSAGDGNWIAYDPETGEETSVPDPR